MDKALALALADQLEGCVATWQRRGTEMGKLNVLYVVEKNLPVILAALRAQQPVVAREPTEAMMQAGGQTLISRASYAGESYADDAIATWIAMHDAAAKDRS
jgi:hypothetical protein